MLKFNVNGRVHSLDVEPEMPLLWVLRDQLGLLGTKYGCGIGQCGSCTVLIDGNAERACLVTAAAAEGRKVVTIEGLSKPGLHRVQKAWIEHEVPQCGYCHTGMIMAAAALLAENPHPDAQAIAHGLEGNLCRCTGYVNIVDAVARCAAAGT